MKTIGLLILFLVVATLGAQTTATPIHFDCVSPTNPAIKIAVNWDKDPFESLHMLVLNNPPISTDTTPPVITSVIYSGGPTVLTDAVKIPATTTSIQFAVTATDDVGIQSFALTVDGFMVSTGNGGMHYLPSPFAIRWNDNTITPGAHAFTLTVFDAAGNASIAKNWSMTK